METEILITKTTVSAGERNEADLTISAMKGQHMQRGLSRCLSADQGVKNILTL